MQYFFSSFLIITLSCCALVVCSLVSFTVTLASRAPFVSGLFNCYVGISRTICSRVCLTVTLVSRALFVFWFV